MEDNVDGKKLALALEAFHAVRAIAAEPNVARGGPYSMKTLRNVHWNDIGILSKMRLAQLLGYAQEYPTSPLALHLKDFSYTSAANAEPGDPVARGVSVKRKKKSGKTGASSRNNQIERGGLVRGSDRHNSLHRGIDPTERRQEETSKRKSRRRGR